MPPNTLAGLTAISGDMPRFPFTSSDSVFRVTPRARAAFVMGQAHRLNTLFQHYYAGVRRVFHGHGLLPFSGNRHNQHPPRHRQSEVPRAS